MSPFHDTASAINTLWYTMQCNAMLCYVMQPSRTIDTQSPQLGKHKVCGSEAVGFLLERLTVSVVVRKSKGILHPLSCVQGLHAQMLLNLHLTTKQKQVVTLTSLGWVGIQK